MSFKLLFGLFVGLVVVAKADSFANFYDDQSCMVNGGIGVDINNDACLGESGRGSVHIPDTGKRTGLDNQYCLVITRFNGECGCQDVGYDFTATGFCKSLNTDDLSYRFIHQPCPPKNC